MATTVDNNVMQVNCSIKPLGRLVELDKTLASRNISVKQENFLAAINTLKNLQWFSSFHVRKQLNYWFFLG